jgi:hypothetical protein
MRMFIITLIILGCTSAAQARQKKQTAKNSKYYVAAYIWPSCHDEETSRKIWPDGTGEWEVIRKGNPRFDGHYQPRQPLWGYEPDDDPKVMERWIDAATEHGVNVFAFDWYWYEGGPFLENTLNNGFLKARNNEKMQFYLMWANHDMPWKLINVHKYGDNGSPWWNAAVDWENYKTVINRVINQYFKQPNYFKIDGMPVFSIFNDNELLESFGGNVEETRKAIDYFRDEVKKAGFPGLHLQWNRGGGYLMSENAAKQFSERVKALGFNSATFYNMGGINEDYLVYGKNSIKIREQMDAVLDIPFFPCVSIGWDDTPRFPAKGMKDVTHYHNTPESFAMLLLKAKQYADSHPEQPKIITVNAWNEWVEGSYLLPDMLNGFGYLEAVKKVIVDRKYDKYMEPKQNK